MDSADLALLRQAQRHIAAAMEATADGEPVAAAANMGGAQAALATLEMRLNAARYPAAATS